MTKTRMTIRMNAAADTVTVSNDEGSVTVDRTDFSKEGRKDLDHKLRERWEAENDRAV